MKTRASTRHPIAIFTLLGVLAGCATQQVTATSQSPEVAPEVSEPQHEPSETSPPAMECAIVAWSCTCSYECRQVWGGAPGATCANACPNLDGRERELPPTRPCGELNGRCSFLDSAWCPGSL